MSTILLSRAKLTKWLPFWIFDEKIAPYFDLYSLIVEADKNGHLEAVKYLMYVYVHNSNDNNDYLAKKNMMIKYLGSVDEYYRIKYFMLQWTDMSRQGGRCPPISLEHRLCRCPTRTEFRQNSSLQSFCIDGDLGMIKYLVALGADIHSDKDVPLRWASRFGHLGVVKYLISFGCKFDRDATQDALEWAKNNNYPDIVECLDTFFKIDVSHSDEFE